MRLEWEKGADPRAISSLKFIKKRKERRERGREGERETQREKT